jgi:hypothetical protein
MLRETRRISETGAGVPKQKRIKQYQGIAVPLKSLRAANHQALCVSCAAWVVASLEERAGAEGVKGQRHGAIVEEDRKWSRH